MHHSKKNGEATMKPTFQDEVQLAGWSETHNGGAKVTFWLSDSNALEPFKRMTVAKGKTAGQRLACVLVEIGDDEQPVQNEGDSKSPSNDQPSARLTGLAMLAVQWCQDDQFCDWLSTYANRDYVDEKSAKEIICNLCGITSRKELNTNKGAADLFDQHIRGPYMMHMKAGQQ